MQPHQQSFLEKRYGFRSYTPKEDASGVTLSQVKLLVEGYLKRQIDYETRDVLLNDDLIYVPYGWIGCGGFLVHRRTKDVMLLGSLLAPHEWVWAFYRRFSFGETKFDRHDTLVISAVHKPKEALRTLHWHLRFEPKFKRFGRQLRDLPCIIRDVDLLFSVRGFMEAEEKGYFDFEINPPDA